MEEKTKEKVNRKDYWLHERIVVKVVTKKLGEKYYKKKGTVRVSILILVHSMWMSFNMSNQF